MERHQGYEQLKNRLKQQGISVRCLEPMSRHCTIQVGGPADLFIAAASCQLPFLIQCCREWGLPYAVIGRGSNLAVSDQGFSGVVIRLLDGKESIRPLAPDGYWLPAGVTLAQAANRAAQDGLSGLEFAHGIPGTVGGAVFMNAGAYGSEMKDILTQVQVLTPDGEVLHLSPVECAFSYRHSRFCTSGELILGAAVRLRPGGPTAIREEMQRLWQQRREKQPLEYPSAGSAFKRPPEGNPPAAALIDRCGLKGLCVGGAQVSEKHAGFIINRGGATAADLRELMAQVRTEVQRQTGVLLEAEIRFLGEE